MGVSPASLEAAGGIGGLLAVHDAAVPGAGTGGGVGPADYVYFYEANGNVAQVVDLYAATPAAAIKVKYEYDPYGQRTNAAAVGEYDQPYRFSTKPFDAESGLSYYGYRYYSAKLGRWINRDPIGEAGGVALYAAFANDPLDNLDALGEEVRVKDPITCYANGKYIKVYQLEAYDWRNQYRGCMPCRIDPENKVPGQTLEAAKQLCEERFCGEPEDRAGKAAVEVVCATQDAAVGAAKFVFRYNMDPMGTCSEMGRDLGAFCVSRSQLYQSQGVKSGEAGCMVVLDMANNVVGFEDLWDAWSGLNRFGGRLSDGQRVTTGLSGGTKVVCTFGPMIAAPFVDPTAGAMAPRVRPPWITAGALPAEEEGALLCALRHIENGTKPTGALSRKWGTCFRNRNLDLPGPCAKSSPYLEYRVAPKPGTVGAGARRVVVDCQTGEMYYTWTHYGQSGAPPFVRIR